MDRISLDLDLIKIRGNLYEIERQLHSVGKIMSRINSEESELSEIKQKLKSSRALSHEEQVLKTQLKDISELLLIYSETLKKVHHHLSY